MTREDWLTRAAAETAQILQARAHLTVPALYVSVGFPRGSRGKRRAIGQCWDGSLSADKRPHVFICPSQADGARVLDILLHEQIHAAVGCDAGHKGAFVAACKAVGLAKPWTATTAGPELVGSLNAIAERLGAYPHAALSIVPKVRPGSRLRLWECACPVKVRVASDHFAATCDDCDTPFERKD